MTPQRSLIDFSRKQKSINDYDVLNFTSYFQYLQYKLEYKCFVKNINFVLGPKSMSSKKSLDLGIK